MNSETKRHIDAARQVLVGVVPNPTSQIEQITNALIYKFMDDMDQASIKAGGEPSFFTGELEPYAWTRIMDSRIGNQERMNLYGEALVKFSQAKQLPELFRGIFKSAFLPYRSPETLGLFLKEIDYFDYSHPEELGNAYEYLLSIMSSQGDAGQFRTPRHIIDFMVDVINPTKDDKVLDPACGTGGFLVSTYKHILEQHDGKNDPDKKEKQLTPDDRKKLMTNFEGYDIDPTMVRIAQVNMYLHQFKNPKIYQYDSLSQEERWGDKFDVILANPPFMSPKGGIKPHSKFSVPSNRSEVLFVDYIINHLRPKGRAGIIVPEGIIFQSGNAYKQLRKSLVNDGLYAVVSLPSGVFAPYSGVKTSILLFNNELAKLCKEILFVKVENDGFDLGATKRPISKNDLPQALQEMRAYQIMVETGKTTTDFTQRIKKENTPDTQSIHHDKFILAKKSFITGNDDYNLSGDRYKPSNLLENTKWPMVKLGDISELMTGGTPLTSKKEYYGGTVKWLVSGDINKGEIFDCKGRITELALKESNAKLLPINSVLIALNGQGKTRGTVAILRTEAACNQSLVSINPNKDKLLPEFLFYSLKAMYQEIRNINGDNQRGGLNMSLIRLIKIPLPPLEIQEQIVKELDEYASIIAGAKQITANWNPKIDIDPEWEKVKLGTVCGYAGGTQPPKSTFIDNPKEGYIRLLQIRDYKSDSNAVYIPKTERHKTCNKTDIMIGRYGPPVFQILRGKEGAYNVALMKCIPDNSKITSDWLYYFLSSDPVQERIISLSGRVRQSGVRPADLDELDIPLPSLGIQKQIVEKIEAERELVDASKKLIKIYEEKIKSALEKLYGHND